MNRILLVLLFAVSVWIPGAARTQPRQKKPALVLVIVVDQMRADYLVRFADLFGKRGFNLLAQEGADFTNCAYDYASTFTGPGHATILSGIPVRTSGIIGNEWFDRQKQRAVYCVEDSSFASVGIRPENAAGRMSPLRFHGRTLGDELTLRSPSSKVIGIAIKDRGAILLAGRHPGGAFWFDPESGNWITSTYYTNALPSWTADFNAAGVAGGFLGRTWERLLPDSCYIRSSPDDAPGEGTLPGEDRPVFPHIVRDLARTGPPGRAGTGPFRRFDGLLPTPFGDELTARFCQAAIEGEQLGRRGATDILAVSFSSPDYCGHTFGPDSQEMEDILLRLDGTLQGLFAYIDHCIGLQNVTVVLTADHGVCPLPESRPSSGGIRIDPRDVLLDVKVRLGQEFNYNEGKDNLIVSLSNSFIYLDTEGIAAHGFPVEAFRKSVVIAALREPGIVRCYTRAQLTSPAGGEEPADSIEVRFARSFNEERSGDIALLTSPFSIWSGGQTGTTHGTPYGYDRHVPLLFYGCGITPGCYPAACRPNDIVPTLAAILDVPQPPGCDGALTGLFAGAGDAAAQTPPHRRR